MEWLSFLVTIYYHTTKACGPGTEPFIEIDTEDWAAPLSSVSTVSLPVAKPIKIDDQGPGPPTVLQDEPIYLKCANISFCYEIRLESSLAH